MNSFYLADGGARKPLEVGRVFHFAFFIKKEPQSEVIGDVSDWSGV